MRIRHSGGYGALVSVAISLVQAEYFSPINYGSLAKRLDCPTDYFSCEDQGTVFAGTCCADGQLCSLDSNGKAACCPSGAVCTGTVASTTGGTPTASFVTNSLYAFPAIPTSFSNAGQCSSAVNACSRNYESCTSGLVSGTGGYAVTVAVPGGGGTTVAPTHVTIPIESATSVCSSLSSKACYGIQSSVCTVTGTTGVFNIGTENMASRPTAACMAGVMAGVGVGILGAQW